MPCKTRFNLPGIPQHVIQRGNNREGESHLGVGFTLLFSIILVRVIICQH